MFRKSHAACSETLHLNRRILVDVAGQNGLPQPSRTRFAQFAV